MILLLDTHFVLAVIDRNVDVAYPAYFKALNNNSCCFSVVSLWEIAIKVRLGKLTTRVALADMAQTLEEQGVARIGLTVQHVIAEAMPVPATRDPFDRLLVATAQHEGMRLVTIDRALADHPVTLRL
jgi:PIN domain nuclease of toxin-antitoxin system